jgi:thiamine-monophosphate kinase
VLRRLAGRAVICADQVVEGVHVERGEAGRRIGRKAAGRALSDLAATAAHPVALLACVAAPRAETPERLRAILAGVDAKAREHGAALVGGDLSSTRGALTVAVTGLGEHPPVRRAPPGRDRARVGQVVLLSGPTGGSRLGRHLDPRPLFELASFLWARGATALMDVSDGLALDLSRLARASRVRIDLVRVPEHADARRAARESGRSARSHALADGEDHELLATLAPEDWRRARSAAARRFPELGEVGRVLPGRGLWLAPRPGARPVPWDGVGGWIHGA